MDPTTPQQIPTDTYAQPAPQQMQPPQAASMPHDTLVKKNTVSVVIEILIYGIEILFIFIEVLIILRFALVLLAANPTANFVSWVYTTSDVFVKPFSGAFTPLTLGTSAIDFTSILALFVYGIIHFILLELAPRLKKLVK